MMKKSRVEEWYCSAASLQVEEDEKIKVVRTLKVVKQAVGKS
jgi:hypothetical protein